MTTDEIKGREPVSMEEAMTWTFQYFYNVAPVKIIEAVYGKDIHPDYFKEKLDKLVTRGPSYFWGTLDDKHQKRLADAVRARYGREEL